MPRLKKSSLEKERVAIMGTLAKKLVTYYGKFTSENLAKVIMVPSSTASTRIRDLNSWKKQEMDFLFKACHYTDQEILEFFGR